MSDDPIFDLPTELAVMAGVMRDLPYPVRVVCATRFASAYGQQAKARKESFDATAFVMACHVLIGDNLENPLLSEALVSAEA